MRSLICFVSILWLLLSTATVVHSKFTATEKMDLMKIKMEEIRKNLGDLTTKTKYLNNKPTYNCRQQGLDDLSDGADMNLRSVQFGPSNDHSPWQMLGSSIRDVKTSFLNMYGRQNKSSCGTLNTPLITTTTKTTTTTIYPDMQYSTQIIASTINNTECSSAEFRCGDGSCIPRYWLCDAQEDCQDCSDEKNCTKDDMNSRMCPDHMFQCSRSGICIQHDWLCDGDEDCLYGEDEDKDNCSGGGVGHTPPPSYGPGDIPCEAGGLPVPTYYRCDGTTDCDNCMDEDQCVDCPASFSAVGHQCLHIDEVKRTWEEASMHCQRRGGRLAEPRDLDALNCFMKEKEGLRARYWVGGSAVEGRWLWSGGAAVPHRLLASGVRHQSLNNREQQPGSDRNCLEIMPRRTRSPFNISNCHTKFRSLCQIDYIN